MIKNKEQIQQIPGWFEPNAMDLFAHMNQIQQDNEITGDIMEIGVYHGKSAAVLGQFLTDDEQFYSCDTFIGYAEQEQFLEDFIKNYANNTGNLVDVIYECESNKLKKEMEDVKSNFRIWHIDGKHSFEDTLQDMLLGTRFLNEDGIIIVDDFLNQDWLGVSEAVNEFLSVNDDYCVFAYGYNKLFLCQTDRYRMYFNAATELNMTQSPHNYLPFHGHNYVSFK